MKVGVVTGFIPLPVKHLTEEKYHALWRRFADAAFPNVVHVGDGPFVTCWAHDLCWGLPPANPVPADRYDTPEINVMSHIVQHERTEWAIEASWMHPDVDVWVWADYGIMKQGAWRNNPLTEISVRRFLDRVASTPEPMDYISFPGIAEKQTVYPTGNVWRFCGSLHIWPKCYLPDIDRAYKHELKSWVERHKTVPLDLPIWALVEQNSKLPFRWYSAEYDASQLDHYPWGTI